MPRREWESPLYGYHGGDVIDSEGAVDIVHCDTCGFKHVLPIPKPEVLETFYKDDFYQSEKQRYLEEAKEDFSWKAVEFKLRLKIASDHLGSNTGRVLDIGCGPGDFLKVASDAGWDALGIEPSPVAAKFAAERGLDVKQGFFDEKHAAILGHFDFIHMSEVLEHVAEPVKLIEQARGLLRPGGMICVSVPNDYNDLQLVVSENFNKKRWWISPDHHLNYFNFDSLTATLENCGFSVNKRLTNFPMELFLLMGRDYTADSSLGRELHGLRKNLDINIAANNSDVQLKLYESLAEANLGRLAIVFASKLDEKYTE